MEVSVQKVYQEVLSAFTPVGEGKEIGLGRERSKQSQPRSWPNFARFYRMNRTSMTNIMTSALS